MATPDDAQTQSPPTPAASPDANAVIQQYLQQILQGGSGAISGPAAPTTPAVNPNLPVASLLGEAFGGGVSPLYPMSEAQQTQAGNAALLNFGIGMLQNSSGPVRHSLGQAIASGLLGAQGSLAGVREGQAQTLDVQNKQQQMRLEQLKTALPLLTLKQQIDQAAAARGLAGGGGATGTGGGIAATGAPITTIARDPSIPTVGQQANNSGNLMVPQGGSLPTGSIGVVPASGGRMVAAFPDASTGIAAQSDNLAGYANAGVNTIRGAVNRWVGDPKANTDSYVADIAKAAGVDPDAKIDLTNPAIQRAFFMAQQPHESGKPWLSPADVDKGIALAAARRTAPPGAPRTAAAPPAATPASTPPATSAAAPGSGFGASAFNAPSRTVMPAPLGGGATAPNTTAQLPPVPTPEMAAARAVAARTNKPAPIAGTDGLFVNPNGSVGPGPGGGGLSKRADVGAIVQGAQTAQTTMPPTAALAAGPAAGGAVTPAAVTPPPANAFGGGAFSGPTPAMIGTPAVTPSAVTPPAVTPPTTTPQPPPPSLYPDIKAGDVTIRHPGSFADYRAKELVPPTGEDFNPNLTPAQEAAFAARQQDLQLKGQQLATLPFAEQPKAAADLTAQRAALEADRQNAIAAKSQAAATATTKYNETQQRDIQDRYNNAATAYNTAAKAQLDSQNKIKEINATSDATASGKALEAINTSTGGAQDVVNQAEMARTLSQAAGTPGFIAMWPKVADNLVRAGLLSSDEVQQLGAQRGLDAVSNKLILALKSQAGFSRFTNKDLEFLQNTAPSSFTPEQLRTPMLAAVSTAAQRQVQYGHLVNAMHASGMPVWQAEQEADKQLGSIIKQPPDMGNIADPNARLAAQGQWVTENVPIGSFYMKPNGQLGIRGGGQQQPQAGQ